MVTTIIALLRGCLHKSNCSNVQILSQRLLGNCVIVKLCVEPLWIINISLFVSVSKVYWGINRKVIHERNFNCILLVCIFNRVIIWGLKLSRHKGALGATFVVR